jgi:hypothetical protein
MAINFLNNVNLNSIQVQDIAIENFTNEAAAGGGVLGQMYFDTTRDTMMQYVANNPATGNPGYIEIGTTSAVESLIAGTGIGISAATGNITVRNTGLVSVLDGTYIDLTKQGGGDNTQLTADLSAVDGTSVLATRFLSKDNTWDVPAFDNYNGWTLSGQSGTAQLIESGDTALFTGGTKITTAVAATDVLTITHDAQTQTDTTSTAAPGYLGTFTAVDSVARDTTGHVTGINVKTVTIPASDDTTYTLPVTAGTVSPGTPTTGIITLTDSDGVTDPVNFTGTTGRIDVSGDAGSSSIIIDLTDDVTILGELTVQGTGVSSFAGDLDMNNNKLTEVKTGTVATDGVNLGQVEALVAGIGLFKGGYNATTGLTVNLGAGNGSLDGASNIALDQGDFFVVTVAGGAFYTQTLEIGDMIFANTTIAANSTPPITDYTVVIADANIATANTTAANTNKGVAGFDSAYFDVTTGADAGWVQLNSQRNPYGATQTLDNTSPVSRAEANGLTTFTIDLADTTLFGASALAKNVAAEVTQNVAPYQTVYADVTRSGTASMSIVFSGSVAVDIYRVLLSHI